jgi:hypothetical protein
MSGAADVSEIEEDDFSEGTVPQPMIEPTKLDRKLEPWHKPRKQIVRQAWSDTIRTLMTDMRPPKGMEKVLRYFTLPAPEMLDIRTLAEAARAKDFKVQYVGFTQAQSGSSDDRQIQLGQTALRAQDDWIHGASDILYYKLEELAVGTNPVARRKLSEYAPFHVVNFDLCDYLLAPGHKAKLFEALAHVLKIQTSRQSDDWLLFIATRFNAANTCPTKFGALRDVIESNCAISPEFEKGLEGLLEIAAGTASDLLKDPVQLSQEHLKGTISVGLTKWIASLLLEASPPFELEMLDTYVYAVDGAEQDMLSFVYRCRYKGKPAAAVETVGKIMAASAAANQPLKTAPAKAVLRRSTASAPAVAVALQEPEEERSSQDIEVAVGLAAIERAKSLVDIDLVLKSDQERFRILSEETKSLLRDANYDDELLQSYDDWAKTKAEKATRGAR